MKIIADDFTSMMLNIDKDSLPHHVAIIMDGNRRWAKARNLPAVIGHKEGEKAFRKIVELCSNIGIKVLTAYAFSVENWKRSAEEVGALMHLFEFYIKEERKYLIENKVKFKILGDKEGIPASLLKEFEKTEKLTNGFNGLTLNLAVNYGSKQEIVLAFRKIAKKIELGELAICDIDENIISSNLMTKELVDPDLLIRTSGEQRISNFLLWQCAYSEFYFSEKYWPDFSEKDFLNAIIAYQKRSRRFGGT